MVDRLRLDIWLDVSCLYRTRSEAQKACTLGKVRVNGAVAKPHRELRVGDLLELRRPFGRVQTVAVTGLADTHLPKAEARQLYEDRTPPPTPEDIEMRRMARLFRATVAPPTRPDRRDRRELRRLKTGG